VTDHVFDACVSYLLRLEGGAEVARDPKDPGGATKWGIASKFYPQVNVETLTREEAVAIYRRDWWERYGYGRLHNPILAAHVLVLAVNAGPSDAGVVLQKALNLLGAGVAEDGVVGSVTIAKCNQEEVPSLLVGAFVDRAVNLYLSRHGSHAEGLVRRAVAVPTELHKFFALGLDDFSE